MITADQLLVHAIGDYVLQSHWMASNKTKQFLAAALHAVSYSVLFLLFRPSAIAFAVILGSHFLIDRYRLARFITWFKNGTGYPRSATGYPDDVPPWLAVWLLIITDNIIHVSINGAALKWL